MRDWLVFGEETVFGLGLVYAFFYLKWVKERW
jgi:hypothetical protein